MNRTEIQVLGMSRSGNHAITGWIFRQAAGRKILLNCAEGKTNPFFSCRPMGADHGWASDPPVDIEAERNGRFSCKDVFIHTYEDSWLGHAFSNELRARREAWIGPSRRRIELVILRDPFNLFASRLRMGCALSEKVALRMWKQHARVALAGGTAEGAERKAVLYNRWVSDRTYRRDLTGCLGLPFTDDGFHSVSGCGGGSSFDGVSFDGEAGAMRTDRRWRDYIADRRYRDIFDRELFEISEPLFGPAPIALDDRGNNTGAPPLQRSSGSGSR